MASGSNVPSNDDRFVWVQKRAPGQKLLDTFVEEEFRVEDRAQARLAFFTAQKLRAEQRRLLIEQEQHLARANTCGFAATGLEQYIVGQEMVVVDLRSRVSPTYGIPQRKEVEKLNVQVNTASETLRFAVSPIADVLVFGAGRQSTAPVLPQAPVSVQLPNAPVVMVPSTQPEMPGASSLVACSLCASDPAARSAAVESQPECCLDATKSAAGVAAVEVGTPTEEKRDIGPRKSVGWNERSVTKKILGRVPLPYLPGLRINKFLPDGAPAFEFREIFGVLPEQIELCLEMDSTRRYGVPTRFILDPTVDYNVIQLKTVDENVGPANQDGVKPRAARELYVSWSSLRAVRVEWQTERMLIRRWSDAESDRSRSMEVPIQAAVTNSRSIPVNLQILGAPFARQYVRSFAMFGEDDGAIAVKRGEEVEWWPFKSAAGRLQ